MNNIANVQKFLNLMIKKGKISQAEADGKLAKRQAKEEAKATYKKDKSKLTKPELLALLDTFTAD